MPSILDELDLGQEFEDAYPAIVYVIVQSIDPINGTDVPPLATAEQVAAAPLTVARTNEGALGGEAGATRQTWWVRCSQDVLGFTLKPRDTLTEDAGLVWSIDAVEDQFAGLAKCSCVLTRG